MSRRDFRRMAMAALVSLSAAAPLAAQTAPEVPTKEQVRLGILDYCVITEPRRVGKAENFADLCRCATKEVMALMTPQEMAEFERNRPITRALNQRYEEALAVCR